MKKNIFSSALNAFKAQFVPVKDDKLRMTLDGNIAAPHAGGYTAFINDELTNVPEDLLLEVPMYRINKKISDLQPGDVIKTGVGKKFTYHKVVSIDGTNIVTNTYGGTVGRKISAVKDFFVGEKTVSVVVNLFGGLNAGNMNPMMLMALTGDSCDKSKLLPLMLMSQGQADQATGLNPMLLMALGDDDSDNGDLFETMLMCQMMGNGQNPFSGLFGQPAAQAETTTQA